jgi:hypothetical protein
MRTSGGARSEMRNVHQLVDYHPNVPRRGCPRLKCRRSQISLASSHIRKFFRNHSYATGRSTLHTVFYPLNTSPLADQNRCMTSPPSHHNGHLEASAQGGVSKLDGHLRRWGPRGSLMKVRFTQPDVGPHLQWRTRT